MRAKGFLSVLLVICVAVVAGCCAVVCEKKAPETVSARVEEKKPIKIGISIWQGYAHAFIAQEKGFFGKNNVSVELVFKKGVEESIELYKSGKVDGVFNVFADMILINSKGIPTKVVYVPSYSESGDVIIGKPEFNSITDLKGKTVSFQGLNTFSNLFVLKALEKAEIKKSDVQFQDVPGMDVLNEMEAGKIDGGHTWEPVTSEATSKGYKILCKASDVPGIITDVLAFNAKIIEERPEDVQGIVKSLFEARDFINSNRDEAMDIMAKAECLDRAEIERGLKSDVHMLDLNENSEAMKKSENIASLYASLKVITDFYVKRGLISEAQVTEGIIEPKFIEGIKSLQTSQP
ncbi:MAG TPA: ABC transporter substrate-binding protein [Candidatus Wunengus sp. YC61]|uniref:ABC transporter substrate-binding protein n=1 Tax=Candidatus Wunengus sp. YC61 TaxID=3367698 RepID=UPI004027E8CA